jgi:hypothetical protein
VPNLVGLTEQQAANELAAAGLAVGAIKHKQNPAQDGKILQQGTAAASTVPSGTKVDLVVAVNLAAPSITNPAAGAGLARGSTVEVRWNQAEPWVGTWKVQTTKQTCYYYYYYYYAHEYRDCRWDAQANATVTATTYTAAYNMSYQPLLNLGWYQTGLVRATVAAVDDFSTSGPAATVEFRIG